MNKLVVFFILSTITIQAQVSQKRLPIEDKTYYWFNIELGKTYDRATKSDKLFIKKISDGVQAGPFERFVEAHQYGLSSGRIIIGPFSEEFYSLKAQSLYRSGAKGGSYSKQEADPEEGEPTFTFFFVEPSLEDLHDNINFKRIPARVSTGTEEDFIGMLSEGLYFKKLAVGPFYSYDLAEKAKFVYRKNGEQDEENNPDSTNSQGLEQMAKKWKSLNLDIIKKSVDKESNKYLYRFSTKFPENYFNPEAFQVITIKASYSDSFNTCASSFTLQGDKVVDNNPNISASQGTFYINILEFDMHDSSKITGFLFESFIYNDTDLIELEPIYVSLE